MQLSKTSKERLYKLIEHICSTEKQTKEENLQNKVQIEMEAQRLRTNAISESHEYVYDLRD